MTSEQAQASAAADRRHTALVEEDFKQQCAAAHKQGAIGGLVTIFVNRVSHRFPEGLATVAEMKCRFRSATLRKYGETSELADEETLDLAGGETFST